MMVSKIVNMKESFSLKLLQHFIHIDKTKHYIYMLTVTIKYISPLPEKKIIQEKQK